MLAILATLFLFLIWSALGLAALAVLRADIGSLRAVLTAPILGTALTVIALFVVSNAGVPMDVGAPPVVVGLLVTGGIILAIRRPRLSLAVLPVALICLAELVLVGRPMFHFGFDWIANANGDMAYYVLSATHLMGHGLQSPVDFQALADNRDFSTSAQVLNLRGLRPGSQITLAGLASLTGQPPVALYMPMTIAIAMGTICATGSLAMQASRQWWAAAVAAALLVASPLAGYAVVQQLLPQGWGLGLGVALFSWLMRPRVHLKGGARFADIAVISLLTVALFIVAYEVASSVILAYAGYVMILIVRRSVSLRAVVQLWSIPIVAIIVVVNTFLPRAVHYLTRFVLDFGTSEGFHGLSQFGYAVVPTALPGAAGFQSMFSPPQTSNMSLYILLAVAFFLTVFVTSTVCAFRSAAAGVTTLSFFALAVMLARNGNDFGLFKLYMYGQPFVAATIAVFVASLTRPRAKVIAGVFVACLVALQVPTLNDYIRSSINPIDLRDASEPDLLPGFRRVVAHTSAPVVVVTDNFALELLQGASAGDRQLYFTGRNLFGLPWQRHRLSVPTARGERTLSFDRSPATAQVLAEGSCVISLPTGSQIALNRRSLPEGAPNLAALPCRKTSNVLAFVVSSLGQPGTLPEIRRAVSFWQLESDPSFPGRTFSGFGRFALFHVFGATRGMRIALDVTTSPTNPPSGSYSLPPAAVVGGGRVRFAVVGAGSARVISPPLTPRIIAGQPYLVLDMGRRGEFPVVPRPGVTGLWGSSVILDPRLLTSYVRDISLISAAEYERLSAPSAIRDIPADLADPNLEYSGIYEDGWIARESYAKLTGGPAGRLVIRAEVPRRQEGQRLRVLVNGREIGSRNVIPGRLELDLAVPASANRRKIELQWAGVTPLGAPDRRTAAARLTFVGIG